MSLFRFGFTKTSLNSASKPSPSASSTPSASKSLNDLKSNLSSTQNSSQSSKLQSSASKIASATKAAPTNSATSIGNSKNARQLFTDVADLTDSSETPNQSIGNDDKRHQLSEIEEEEFEMDLDKDKSKERKKELSISNPIQPKSLNNDDIHQTPQHSRGVIGNGNNPTSTSASSSVLQSAKSNKSVAASDDTNALKNQPSKKKRRILDDDDEYEMEVDNNENSNPSSEESFIVSDNDDEEEANHKSNKRSNFSRLSNGPTTSIKATAAITNTSISKPSIFSKKEETKKPFSFSSATTANKTKSSNAKKSNQDDNDDDDINDEESGNGDIGFGGGNGGEGGSGKSGVLSKGEHEHNSLPWLQPDSIRDLNGRKQDDPFYDCATLFVPPGYLAGNASYHSKNFTARKITDSMSVWWDMKSRYYDCVLFYKVGKFYECYHMDADVVVRVCGVLYMKGDFAHCGFPEKAYGKFSRQVVKAGYRVARVEQVETVFAKEERRKSNSSKEAKGKNMVKRDVCAIVSPGTRTLNVRDVVFDPLSDEDDKNEDKRTQLLSIVEMPSIDMVSIGVSCLDPTTGKIKMTQFVDDNLRSNLRTLLVQEYPAEVTYTRNRLSHETLMALKDYGSEFPLFHTEQQLKKNINIDSPKEFADIAIKLLTQGGYFKNENIQEESKGDQIELLPMPKLLEKVMQLIKESNKDIANASMMVLSSLGLMLELLKRSLIDFEIVSMANVSPISISESDIWSMLLKKQEKNKDKSLSSKEDKTENDMETDLSDDGIFISDPGTELATNMRLDGQAIRHLEILYNTIDFTTKGSLLEYLDHCGTKFGKRLLRHWVSSPLYNKSEIINRQQIVSGFVKLFNEKRNSLVDVRKAFQKLPDIERLLNRIHSIGVNKKLKNHPDANAVLYELAIYDKHKIDSLAGAIQGLEMLNKCVKSHLQSAIEELEIENLYPLIKNEKEANSSVKWRTFPNMEADIQKMHRLFDVNGAKREGKIVPTRGVSKFYDQACNQVEEIIKEIENELPKACNDLGSKKITFFTPKNGKDKYQLEVAESVLESRDAPSSWRFLGKRKGFRRYHTPKIKSLLDKLEPAELEKADALQDFVRALFAEFDKNRSKWQRAVSIAAEIDCYLSLAMVSASGSDDEPMSIPRILDKQDIKHKDSGDDVFLHIDKGRHPTVALALERNNAGRFIPNDIYLGTSTSGSKHNKHGKCLLLTGPNMGGKSTLLRQTCIIVIMAQIGCYVPAEECVLTPVDRIFTRIGASDNILAGQSTFFVELSETSNILHSATKNSLVILDELGRGTSTFDGTAIAYAVVNKLCSNEIGCRTMFATHYHSLVQEFGESDDNSSSNSNSNTIKVSLAHMDCVAIKQDNPDKQNGNQVAFLYKLVPGPSDKSYGLNVAKLAGVPDDVIQMAHIKSTQFEQSFIKQQINSSIVRLIKDIQTAVKNNDQAKLQLLQSAAEKLLSMSSSM